MTKTKQQLQKHETKPDLGAFYTT